MQLKILKKILCQSFATIRPLINIHHSLTRWVNKKFEKNFSCCDEMTIVWNFYEAFHCCRVRIATGAERSRHRIAKFIQSVSISLSFSSHTNHPGSSNQCWWKLLVSLSKFINFRQVALKTAAAAVVWGCSHFFSVMKFTPSKTREKEQWKEEEATKYWIEWINVVSLWEIQLLVNAKEGERERFHSGKYMKQ